MKGLKEVIPMESQTDSKKEKEVKEQDTHAEDQSQCCYAVDPCGCYVVDPCCACDDYCC